MGEETARRITPGGLLVGRSPRCDIVLRDPKSSRRQALVYLADEGARLSVMGRGAVRVDGEPVDEDVGLEPGNVIEVEDVAFEVVREEAEEGAVETSSVWVLETSHGGLFSFSHSPFRVGGGDADDLRVESLPESALAFRSREGGLEVKGDVDLVVDEEEVPAGEVRRLRRGSQLSAGDVELRIVTGGELGGGSTMTLENERAARGIRLEFLPRGGRLHVKVGSGEHSVYLTDRRCDFIAVLLQPPAPLEPGDYVTDELVWNRVWGKQPSGKKTLHVLLHRLRRDLDRVGLDGSALLERSEGGGATRFVLVDGAPVTLE